MPSGFGGGGGGEDGLQRYATVFRMEMRLSRQIAGFRLLGSGRAWRKIGLLIQSRYLGTADGRRGTHYHEGLDGPSTLSAGRCRQAEGQDDLDL